MTLACILRLRSQARFAQDDTALRERGSNLSKSTTKLRTALGPGRPFMSRGCGLATDQKAVQRRGPGRVVLGSKPQLATTEKLVRWATRASARTAKNSAKTPSVRSQYREDSN